MDQFKDIIGYEAIKKELLLFLDMVKNKSVYEKIGAEIPFGILLYGDPGVGKTLLATTFMEATGRKSYVLRRTKAGDDFVNQITAVFREAAENAPSVILLDDMDKFAVEELNTEEYVVLQSAIDDYKSNDIIVLGTANDISCLPSSLTRSGRFDKKFHLKPPDGKEAEAIICHYLKGKPLDSSIDVRDIAKMYSGLACVELQSILNEAACYAAYERKDLISKDQFIKAALQREYGIRYDDEETTPEKQRLICLHEAGHVAAAEVLEPECIGYATVVNNAGHVSRCSKLRRRPFEAIIALAGKVAVELTAPGVASGCQSDIEKASGYIWDGITESGTAGLGMIDVVQFPQTSPDATARAEAVTIAEMERMTLLAKKILLENREFLEKLTNALCEKKTLLFSDIQSIKKTCRIVPTDILV